MACRKLEVVSGWMAAEARGQDRRQGPYGTDHDVYRSRPKYRTVSSSESELSSRLSARCGCAAVLRRSSNSAQIRK